MIHNILWIKTKVGSREAGLANLNEMAAHIRDEHGLRSRVGIPVTSGPIYLAGLLTVHESMGSMQKTNEKLGRSDFFQDWFGRSKDLYSFEDAEWQTLRVHHSAGMNGGQLPNFTGVYSFHAIPGKLISAREHLFKVADHMAATYSRPARVLSPEGGEHYRHLLSVDYDDLDQFDDVSAKLDHDQDFAQWANEMPNLFDMKTTVKNVWAYV